MLFPTFKNTITQKLQLSRADKVIVAVSGGVDSMVLAALFLRLAKSLNFKLHFAHINHHLRGEASAADETLVAEFAKQHGICFHLGHWKTQGTQNKQAAAREFRQDFLTKIASKEGANKIATAHHQQDQAETVLLHLIRGCGLKGLTGMKLCENIHGVDFIRPLLFAAKSDMIVYAKEHNVPYNHDQSNDEFIYLRNKVRHQLVPLLQEMNPQIVERLSKMSSHLTEDEQTLNLLAREYFSQICSQDNSDSYNFSRIELLELPKALRSRLLSLAFEQLAGDAHCLNSDQLRRINEICSSNDGNPKVYQLAAGWQFSRKRNQLCLQKIIKA